MLTDRPFGSLIREDSLPRPVGLLDRHAKPITFDAIRIKWRAAEIRDGRTARSRNGTINTGAFKPDARRSVRRASSPDQDYE